MAMKQRGKLPHTNDRGFFEIRLESIGGLGANVAGKILAEAGVFHAWLNASNFASYGSEKKGSPVKSFIRFCQGERPIRDSTPIARPHVLGVFHEALLTKSPEILSGLYPHSVVVVNSHHSPQELRERFGLTCVKVGSLPALDIAVAEGSRTNMAMLGALVRACSFLPPDAVVETLQNTLGVKYPKLLPNNLAAFWRGYNETVWGEVGVDAQAEALPSYSAPPQALGYSTQPIGGVIDRPGSMANKDLSSSRQGFLPEFDRQTCIDCAQCELVCPDFCFVWAPGTDALGRPALVLEGIDYQYCKGCLKCVEACPTDALRVVAETDGFADERRVPSQWDAAVAGGRQSHVF